MLVSAIEQPVARIDIPRNHGGHQVHRVNPALLVKRGVGGTQQHRLDAGRRLNRLGALRDLLAHRLAILALERIIAVAVGADLAPGIGNRFGSSGRGFRGIARKEERRRDALFLEHLQDLLGRAARALVKCQGHVLFVALGRYACALDHAVGGGHDLAAVLRLARLLADPYLGAALNAPGFDILNGTSALDLNLWLDSRGLDLVLFVRVAAVLDRHLLATRKLATIPFALLHALAVNLHRQLFAAMALEHAVVDGQQIAGIVRFGQALIVDKILQRRAHAHRGLLPVEFHVHAAVDVAHDGSDKQHERATHGDERIGQAGRSARRAPVADARAAIAKPTAMVEVHRAGLTAASTLAAGQLPQVAARRRTRTRGPV